MNKHEGIILRHSIPKHYTIALFDKRRGRIDGIVSKKALYSHTAIQHGAHISYSLKESHLLLIENIEIINIPLQLAAIDIEFLHQILELCNFYLTDDYTMEPLFDLTRSFLSTQKKISPQQKQLFLCIFFAHIGLYPDTLPFKIEELRKNNISYLQKKLDELGFAMIQSWILECINMHPYKNKFRTLHTLNNKQ